MAIEIVRQQIDGYEATGTGLQGPRSFNAEDVEPGASNTFLGTTPNETFPSAAPFLRRVDSTRCFFYLKIRFSYL
jgi:hypothetical protein